MAPEINEPRPHAHWHVGALIAFFFPAAVGLKALQHCQARAEAEPRYWRASVFALIGLGVVQAATGIAAVSFRREAAPANAWTACC